MNGTIWFRTVGLGDDGLFDGKVVESRGEILMEDREFVIVHPAVDNTVRYIPRDRVIHIIEIKEVRNA